MAQKPRGWRVRTKRTGRHELRIGFPPDARRKGSGKLLEILHPKGEQNPDCELAGKNPAELIIFGNPYGVIPDDEKSARKLFRSGHNKLTEFQTPRGAEGLSKRLRKKGIKTTAYKYEKGRAVETASRLMYGNPSNHKPGCNCAICKNARGEKHSPGCQCVLCRKARGENPKRKRNLREIRTLSPFAQRKLAEQEARLQKLPKPRRAKRKRNQGDETGQAVKLFQTFHGKDPRGIIEKHVSDAMRMEYTALGALEYLLVENEDGAQVKINFDGDGVTLASSPQANQLYFIGGNQNLAPCLDKFTDDASKDLIDLGDALEVQYLARKAQGNFEPVKYFHKFGEEKRGSDLPRAIYDQLRKQVFLAGGEYTIEQPGIIN